MKRFWPLFAMTMVLPATVFAGNDCHYIGSWFGYNGDGEIAWTSQAVGQNKAHGTMLLEAAGFDITFGGAFDPANSTGNLKGVWERTGENTFRYAAMGFAVDEFGDALWAMRLTGDLAVTGECDILEVTNTQLWVYFVDPANDPVPIWDREADVGPITFPSHHGHRIELDLP